MPDRNRHIILRQVFHLQFPRNADGFALQQQIGRIAADELQPALEALFDRFASPDELIRFDKLEIDIGKVSAGQLEEALTKAVVRELERLLLQQITYSAPGAGGFEIEVASADHFKRWLFFLEKGYLSWQASGASEADIHLAVLEQAATDANAVDRLGELLQKHPPALIRLVQQHPETFLVSLLEAITAQTQKQLPAWLAELERLLRTANDKHPSRSKTASGLSLQELWIAIFKSALERKPDRVGTEALISAFWETRLKAFALSDAQAAAFRSTVREILEKEAGAFPLLSRLKKVLTTAKPAGSSDLKAGKPGDLERKKDSRLPDAPAEQESPLPGEIEDGIERRAETPGREVRPAKDANNIESAPEQEDFLKSREDTPPTAEEAGKDDTAHSENFDVPSGSVWYVGAAGMVLLHPFYKAYFEFAGLLENGNFRSEEARRRAVHLLYFLATGETGPPEYELVLPKFLCGLPLGSPIERAVELTQAEREEAEKLLTAAISHWNKLGHTSPQGLREGFLQREGKLEKRNDNWYLSVQQQGIDILLDFLPWNLSMIKLPWMPELLRVEWG
jgi:hypothetical protein